MGSCRYKAKEISDNIRSLGGSMSKFLSALWLLMTWHLLVIGYIKDILPKGPYLPCVSMAGRALLAGYHRYADIWMKKLWYIKIWFIKINTGKCFPHHRPIGRGILSPLVIVWFPSQRVRSDESIWYGVSFVSWNCILDSALPLLHYTGNTLSFLDHFIIRLKCL